jgi:hypothetical protein
MSTFQTLLTSIIPLPSPFQHVRKIRAMHRLNKGRDAEGREGLNYGFYELIELKYFRLPGDYLLQTSHPLSSPVGKGGQGRLFDERSPRERCFAS